MAGQVAGSSKVGSHGVEHRTAARRTVEAEDHRSDDWSIAGVRGRTAHAEDCMMEVSGCDTVRVAARETRKAGSLVDIDGETQDEEY